MHKGSRRRGAISMRQSSKKLLITLAVALILLGGGVIAYMYADVDPPGYCRAQHRFISDEEFLKASVALLEWQIDRVVTVYPSGEKMSGRDAFKVPDFNPANPNCCSVGREVSSSIFDRYFGLEEVEVRLNPKTSEKPVSRMGDGFIQYTYNVCGELQTSSFGHPTSGRTMVTTDNYLDITDRKGGKQ